MINREGYFVVYHANNVHTRTYACTDKAGLAILIEHLTGRSIDTYETDKRGLPSVLGMLITYPLHIYSGNVESLLTVGEVKEACKMNMRELYDEANQ